ncbi:IS3 family transposase [Sulfobacillus thermosulfidooxidans]|uniref:IS3 family transposase n=1 Tax=Sulfobacillus thermosulfidooxidans TaxID=28034 RepID=UPI0002E1432D|nr:IS3 family transposase [Sulfobacillus thermosulfidooxidans]
MGESKTITPELKAQCIQEALDIRNAAAVARRHGLSVRLVQKWVHTATKHGTPEEARALKKALQQATTENHQLKQLLGEKDLEIAILHDLLKKRPPGLSDRCEVAHRWIQQGYPPTRVCQLAGVARATYYAWRARRQRPASWTPKRGGGRPRRGYVWTANDTKVAEGQVLEWLSEFIMAGDGQAYGYRKLTTWLRREHGLIINKKTVYRLLRSADLLQGQPLRPSGNRRPVFWPPIGW